MQKMFIQLTPFRHTECHHTSSHVKDLSLRYYTDLVQGPQTLAQHHRVGAEQTLLPTSYLCRTDTICPAGMFVQMVHFTHKLSGLGLSPCIHS